MESRQTFSYLAQRLAAAGHRPRSRFGQNFLVDLNLIDVIARSGELTSDDVVLEVGTGGGSLTSRLAKQAAWVVSVEIDTQLARVAADELSWATNVTLLQQDALKGKNRLAPEVIEALKGPLQAAPNRRLKLVANLPYNVATPILANLLDHDPAPVRMVATIQKELAERIAAKPNTRDYSALSIWMQAQAKVEILRTLPPSVFWPQPKVTSAILLIAPDAQRRGTLSDPAFFHRTVREIYLHRRKFLRSAIAAAFHDRLDKPTIDSVLGKLQLPPNTRAESLDVPQTILLVEALRQVVPQDPASSTEHRD
jgi:16S rRNA (adenine1518-N6/adenine1519-N6)-dimethyltransferase